MSAEPGFCKCGCGLPTAIAPCSWKARGWVKGKPKPGYVLGHSGANVRREPGKKECSGCDEMKLLEAFQRSADRRDGRMVRCAECESERRLRAREADPVAYAEKARRWRQANPEAFKATQERYIAKSSKAKRQRAAKAAVNSAIQTGHLVRPERCEMCEETRPVEGHHADYDRLLDVEWLCRECHLAHHGKRLWLA